MTTDSPAAAGRAAPPAGHAEPVIGRAADRLLLSVVRRTGGWALVLVLAALGSVLAQVLLPAVVGSAVDSAMAGRTDDGRITTCTAVIVVFIVCEVLSDLAAGRSSAAGTAWLRRAQLAHLLTLGGRATARFDPGDLTARLIGGAADAGAAAEAAVWAALSVLPTLTSVVALWLIDPWLALTFLVGMPALVFFLRSYAQDMSALIARYQKVQGAVAAGFVEALGGMRTIAAAGTTDREAERVLRPLPELSGLGHGFWRAQTKVAAQNALLVPLLEVAVLSVAGFGLAAGRVTPGEMLAASRYAGLGAGLGMTAMYLGRLARARAGGGRIREVLAEPAAAYGTGALPAGPGRLELRGVTVRVGGQTLLDGLDLTVPGGTSLAIVGRSGTGKSLLAAVAGRLTDPHGGTVLLDGVPLPELSHEELRGAVGYAFERPALLGRTLGEAIALDDVAEADRPRLSRAAAAACIDAFVERLPEGYRTDPREVPMSGGEAQRLGLARAFAHRGRVLVLDDATSSLDTVTEFKVSTALTTELADRTRLIVAHRASTAARCDLVAWLDGGGIRRVGPHEELWALPEYRAVFRPDQPADEDRSADEDRPAGDDGPATGDGPADERGAAARTSPAEVGA
ncbi:ABC transporter ATP-binding protein [Kitasatospora xanthocidica]|uniref:ABC transporter ATP-binding protein n=1 Tax=Kitasatospora xanthocidica TaxID=83382 RepID=UPI00167301F1|nr:ABC transporter ATP-binding protein [Kitasatospora xanthocidica]GHF27539.1 ABC transporter ATP-binding protein [Kitasatospora xanthocidica]